MKLRLFRNRSIGLGLVRLAAGLTVQAAERLAGVAEAPEERVHDARVSLKRARSVLRVLEKAGADWARAPRFRLALLAAMMSDVRENAVAAAMARRLARRWRGPERAVAMLLASQKRRMVPPDVAQIEMAIRQEARELAIAPVPIISPAELRQLLRWSLQRAARRHLDAVSQPRPETVHEWRKAVIVLRDQTALASKRWPDGAGVAHRLLVRLALRLGHRGDLALLVCRLQRLRVPPNLRPARQRLIARLDWRCEQVTAHVLLRWLRLERRLTRLLKESNSLPEQQRMKK